MTGEDLKKHCASIIARKNLLPLDQQLPFLKQQIAAISDPKNREFAEYLLFSLMDAPPAPRPIVIILIHGIRTHAIWQELIEAELPPEITVYKIKYGYFDGFKFWFPWGLRLFPISKVLREYRGIRKKHKNSDISVVAHSFGTYIISKILSSNPDVELNRLLLCGSVVCEAFRWDKLPNATVIVNDVGSRDKWPVAAKVLSWGYGCSGTIGFGTHMVQDRYHNLDHGGFFTTDFVKQFWLPFLTTGRIVKPTTPRESPSWWLSLFTYLPVKSLVAILVVGSYVIHSWQP